MFCRSFKETNIHALRFMNVSILENNHRQVSATHVAVFRVITTRIKKNKYHVSDNIGKVACQSGSQFTKCIFCAHHSSELFFYLAKHPPQWTRASSYMRQDSSGRVITTSQRPLADRTQQSQQRDIHVPGGIRNHNLSRRAAADLGLRPRGHWDRLNRTTLQ